MKMSTWKNILLKIGLFSSSLVQLKHRQTHRHHFTCCLIFLKCPIGFVINRSVKYWQGIEDWSLTVSSPVILILHSGEFWRHCGLLCTLEKRYTYIFITLYLKKNFLKINPEIKLWNERKIKWKIKIRPLIL